MRKNTVAAMQTARPRGPVDNPLTQRDCEADGAAQNVANTNAPVVPAPRHPATNIGE